jgi:predicted Zn-ribbon and HTH transcriptional regulator
MDKAKILRLCNEIEDAVNEIDEMCEIIDFNRHKMLISKLREIGKVVSELHHAYWIPTECGVKCSECGTEYADTNYPERMFQCPNCYAQMGEPKKLTNADRVRQMTDEELAEKLRCDSCLYQDMKSECESSECVHGILAWLQKEVEKDAKSDPEEP